jgi:hypothetical protein
MGQGPSFSTRFRLKAAQRVQAQQIVLDLGASVSRWRRLPRRAVIGIGRAMIALYLGLGDGGAIREAY